MITIIKDTDTLIRERQSERNSVGFVPTMGNLHDGHISLLTKALENSEVVYFSIFVNPKQFGPQEDFNRYPRTLEHDLQLIESAHKSWPTKKIVVFAPLDPAEVFPPQNQQVVSVPHLNLELEGSFRPTHFDGVTTVVYRLFDLIKPDKAYFGLKDYQQYLIIQKMVEDLAMPIQIVGMPIKREPTGLAMSSRNQYLSTEEREEALVLSHTLRNIEDMIHRQRKNLTQAQDYINQIVQDPKWNYLEMRDASTLSRDLSSSKKITILAVYQLGSTRLLDNIQLELE
jgi:pantoate--beta-alanine ligase